MLKSIRCHNSIGSHATDSVSGTRSTIEWIDEIISIVVLPLPKDWTASPTTPHPVNNSNNSDHNCAERLRRRVLSQQRERVVSSLCVSGEARQVLKNSLTSEA